MSRHRSASGQGEEEARRKRTGPAWVQGRVPLPFHGAVLQQMAMHTSAVDSWGTSMCPWARASASRDPAASAGALAQANAHRDTNASGPASGQRIPNPLEYVEHATKHPGMRSVAEIATMRRDKGPISARFLFR
ncbi:hypothetical protein B0H16DRAFT_1466730 [Mycena metata]|uniref:Uncharacterized protein n=1 Tax=Mycena metata TaxID=1033252 RepID=A0AAD7I7S8_9AGAR|nr:hypothetical protein B0H16DRAFT_1466730 [Mycena metata]